MLSIGLGGPCHRFSSTSWEGLEGTCRTKVPLASLELHAKVFDGAQFDHPRIAARPHMQTQQG
jgi:hypothetical protein